MTPRALPPESDLRQITARLRDFAKAREWEGFHTPKNLAMALAVEAAELMEPFQWLAADEASALAGSDPEAMQHIGEELADVAIYLIRLADVMSIDLGRAISMKIDANEARFPIEQIRGRARLPGKAG